MKKFSFLKCFVETLPIASESLVKTLRATSLLGMMVFAPMGANAQVTIGSNALPQATLDIIGAAGETGKAFRLDDGNQFPGYVITAQENGVGTWKPVGLTILQSTMPQPATGKSLLIKDYPTLASEFIDTDFYVDLKPGQYMILTYIPVFFNFAFDALETVNYRIGLRRIDGTGGTEGLTVTVPGPMRANVLQRQFTIFGLNTLSDTSTTRYYLSYSEFKYLNSAGTNVTTTNTRAATNAASFILTGTYGIVYAIPLVQP